MTHHEVSLQFYKEENQTQQDHFNYRPWVILMNECCNTGQGNENTGTHLYFKKQTFSLKMTILKSACFSDYNGSD